MFVDESAANCKTGWRKRGWSPKGLTPRDLQSTPIKDRMSVLPAMTISGYIEEATLIHPGSINRDLYLHWHQFILLPLLTPGYHILVMDNNSTHHGEDIRPVCEGYGIEIQYRPPYSPDYNPSELTFNVLKA